VSKVTGRSRAGILELYGYGGTNTVALSTLKLVLDRVTDRSIAAVEARSMTPLDTRTDRPINVIVLNNRPSISMAAMLLAIRSYMVEFCRGESG